MTINKLVAGAKGDPLNSSGADVRDAVNALIDFSEGASSAGGASSSGLAIADMHFNILQGIPCRAAEVMGSVTYSLASPSAIGSSSLSLVDATGIIQDQLITVFDGAQYYAHRVTNVSANDLTLSPGLKANIAAGDNVFNFYQNEYHPNEYGYKAIADSLIDSQLHSLEYKTYAVINVKSAGSTLVDSTAASINSICANESIDVTLEANGSVSQDIIMPKQGIYTLEFFAITGGNAIVVSVDGEDILTTKASGSGRYTAEFFGTALKQSLRFEIEGGVVGGFNMSKKVSIAMKSGGALDVSAGSHLMLGDSWLASNTLVDRMAERLPNATFTNKGVGGRTSASVLAAFDDDYVGDYDFVWVMVGTNDYAGGSSVSPENFRKNVSQLVAKIISKGATPIVISTSVGTIDTSTAQFTISRQYVIDEYKCRIDGEDFITTSFGPVTLQDGTGTNIAELGLFRGEFKMIYSYALGNGLSVVRKSSMNSSGTQITTIADNSPSGSYVNADLTGNQWVSVRADNNSGVEQTYYGYVKHSRSEF